MKEYLTENSWVEVIDDALLVTDDEFQELWKNKPTKQHTIKVYGKEYKVPRTQVTYYHSYKFSGNILEPEAVVPELVDRCLEYVKKHNQDYEWNGVLANFYKDGTQCIGRHSDDTSSLVHHSPIYSFSFGETRTFRIRNKFKKKSLANRDIPTKNGRLIIMGGSFQEDLTHEIPRDKTTKPRINITIRAFKNNSSGNTGAKR